MLYGSVDELFLAGSHNYDEDDYEFLVSGITYPLEDQEDEE